MWWSDHVKMGLKAHALALLNTILLLTPHTLPSCSLPVSHEHQLCSPPHSPPPPHTARGEGSTALLQVPVAVAGVSGEVGGKAGAKTGTPASPGGPILSPEDRGTTPERAEFENSVDQPSDGDEYLSEDEWTDRNFGASANELDDSDNSDYSDLRYVMCSYIL